MDIEKKLKELYGLELPAPPAPGGVYSPAVKTGNLVYISGQTPGYNGVLQMPGRVGADLSLEDGKLCARYCMLNILTVLKGAIGDFSKVKKFVQLVGFVQCTEDFHDQPLVINGASELLRDLFGEKGLPTRMALGTNALPANSAVEILAVVEVED